MWWAGIECTWGLYGSHTHKCSKKATFDCQVTVLSEGRTPLRRGAGHAPPALTPPSQATQQVCRRCMRGACRAHTRLDIDCGGCCLYTSPGVVEILGYRSARERGVQAPWQVNKYALALVIL